MISLPASITAATVPSRKQARKELGPFLHGQRVRLAPRDSEPGVPVFLHALLRQVEPFPAAVLSARWDILAFNRSYDALFGLESVPARNRNAMLLYFADAGQRELRPDWAADAPRVVSQIRAAMAQHDTDPEWATLLERLGRASPDFDRMWQQAGTGSYDHAPERFRHPVTGVLRLARFHLWAEPREDGLVAVGYTPADAATAVKLPRLQALSTLPVARNYELPPTVAVAPRRGPFGRLIGAGQALPLPLRIARPALMPVCEQLGRRQAAPAGGQQFPGPAPPIDGVISRSTWSPALALGAFTGCSSRSTPACTSRSCRCRKTRRVPRSPRTYPLRAANSTS